MKIADTKSGWLMKDFARMCGLSRTVLYILPDDAKPRQIKIGRRVVITEGPHEWLARMKARGGVETLNTLRKKAGA